MTPMSLPVPQSLASRLTLFGIAMLAALPCVAQNLASEGSEASPTQLETVTVNARRSLEDRFNATGSLVVVDRKDIEALGAFSVVDVLRQLPSVQVTPAGDGTVSISMRGQGASATQLLVDGQRVSSGKSQLPLDQLPAELIERIEVVRAPTAEFSGATGGTLNLVLRAATVRRETNLRLADNTVWGQHTGQVFFSNSGPLGRQSAGTAPQSRPAVPASGRSAPTEAGLPVSDALAQPAEPLPQLPAMVEAPWAYFVAASSTGMLLGSDIQRQTRSAGSPTLISDSQGRYRRNEMVLLPKVSGRLGASEQLTLRGTWSHTRYNGAAQTQGETYGVGIPSQPFASFDGSNYQRHYGQAGADWTHRFANSKLDSTLSASRARYAHLRLGEVANAGAAAQPYAFNDAQRDTLWTLKSKLTGTSSPLLWSGGWELESRRVDASTQSANNQGSSSLDLHSRIERQVLWAQNEWELPARTTLTAGLRGEQLRTRSDDPLLLTARDARFLQPSLHSRTPVTENLQWRLNLARVTRLPTVWDLVARTNPSYGQNTLSNPDYAGNPDLRPEVAWSLDTGWEQRLSQQGQLGLNLFVRRLGDTLATLTTLRNGRWVQTRANVGDAMVWGLEADVKSGLTGVGLGRDWTLSANASLLQSRMTSGPNEGSRIPGQARYTANLNIAKPLRRQGGLFGGASVSLTGPAQLNTSPGISGQDHARAMLDVYLGGVLPNLGYWRAGVYNIGNVRFDRERYVSSAGATALEERSSMTLTPRVYLTLGTQFCDAFKPC